jgi:ribonuclease HI
LESERFCRSKPSEGQIACRLREQAEWQAPVGDTLKINTDGSFSELTGVGGWGFVIRDKDGTIRGAGAGFLAHVASAAGAEAIACQEALQAAASWGMEQVQVESDAKNLVKAMQNPSLDHTPKGVIYRDIRCFSRLNFSSISFSFCPRTRNNMAHDLAAVGVRKQVVRSLWLEPSLDDVLVTSTFAESDF